MMARIFSNINPHVNCSNHLAFKQDAAAARRSCASQLFPMPRSVKALENDLAVLESKYNICSEHLAKGESEDFSPEWLGSNQSLGIHTHT